MGVWLWGLVMLGTAGCISSDILRLDTRIRPTTDPAEIRVLAAEPAVPYAVIAVIAVSTRTDPLAGGKSVEALRNRLRREAAKLGGHAVLLDAGSLARTEEQRRLSAKVIVFDQ
jgi:hypothetical protein